MSVAKFKVVGRLDMASRPSVGTVLIDRQAGLFSVRPLRRHKMYTLPLSSVAELVCRSIIAAEVREKKAKRKLR